MGKAWDASDIRLTCPSASPNHMPPFASGPPAQVKVDEQTGCTWLTNGYVMASAGGMGEPWATQGVSACPAPLPHPDYVPSVRLQASLERAPRAHWCAGYT
jgi:hypothetical protein